MLVEAAGDAGDLVERLRGQVRQAADIGVDHARRTGEGLGGLFGRRGKILRRAGQVFVDRAEIGRGVLDQFAETAAGLRQAIEQFVDLPGQRFARAFHRRQRFGGAAGDGVDQRGVFTAHTLGRLLGGGLEALLQFAARFLETLDQRPRLFVDDSSDVGRTARQQIVELACALVERLGGFLGALTDMLVHRREGLGDHVGARNQLGLGLRHLLDQLFADPLGAAGKPLLGGLDLAADLVDDRIGTVSEPLLHIGKRRGDLLGALGQLAGGFLGALDDALVGLLESAHDAAGAFEQRPGRAFGACGQLLVGLLEHTRDRLGAFTVLRARRAGARGKLFVGRVERARQRDGALRQLFAGCGDALVESASGLVESLADVVGPAEKRRRGLFDPLGDALVCVLEHLAGVVRQRGGDFKNLVTQGAGHDHGGVFDRRADIVHAHVERALHGARALFDHTGLATEGFFDLFDVAGERLGDVASAARQEVDVSLDRGVDHRTGLG